MEFAPDHAATTRCQQQRVAGDMGDRRLRFAQKYEPRIELGTLLTLMLPYSISFAIGWTLLLVTWLVMGIPLGPGSGVVYPPA